MPQYAVVKPFPHKGRVQKKGKILSMTELEARYLVMGSAPWIVPVEEIAKYQGAPTEMTGIRDQGLAVREETAKPQGSPIETMRVDVPVRTDTADTEAAAPKAPKGKKSEEPAADELVIERGAKNV